MLELKALPREAVPAALDKAEHYRFLNEPREAESICLDVLAIEPDNQRAARTLLLALTDQFDRDLAGIFDRAREAARRLEDDYSRAYYGGIVFERAAKARLRRGGPHANFIAHDWLQQALEHFEAAEKLAPAGNPDATLRWNTCVRLFQSNPALRSGTPELEHQMLE
ncbi:MAG TPA: hypothetical protein VF017_12830 [Thermoanaerobaculia bacterium]|nr:hypothetical protein [Thermoanaerobaculia bacterium]